MILSFKRTFPWGDPTFFDQRIEGTFWVRGHKIHTIRPGMNRNPGDKLYFWSEKPQNKSLGPYPFNLGHPSAAVYWFDVTRKKVVHRDEMTRIPRSWPMAHEEFVPLIYATEDISISIYRNHGFDWFRVDVGSLTAFDAPIDFNELQVPNYWTMFFHLLAYYDGFENPNDFVRWFATYRENGVLRFVGQIIHWTDRILYDAEFAQVYNP